VPATTAVSHASLPIPTVLPPAQCQFGNEVVSVPLPYPQPLQITPGVVPTIFQSQLGWITLAAGDIQPGVFAELRLPRTTFVAGALISPEIRIQNTTAHDLNVYSSSALAQDDSSQVTGQRPTPDPRIFRDPENGPRPYPRALFVPAGQTWAFSNRVQLPFDTSASVTLRAFVTLVASDAPAPTSANATPLRQSADVPLHLVTPRPDQQLHLDLRADSEQWCVRVTDAQGKMPSSPLAVSMLASEPQGAYVIGARRGHNGNTWGDRWPPDPRQIPIQRTVNVWVGGSDYPTALATTTTTGP